MNKKTTPLLVTSVSTLLVLTTQAADLSGSTLDFNTLDKNGDGKISRSEFAAAKLAPIGAGKGAEAKDAIAPKAETKDQGWFLRSSAFGAQKKRTGFSLTNDLSEEPAQISWVRQGGGSESYAIDAGLGIRLSPWAENPQGNAEWLIWAGADYQRNTTPGGLVDQSKFGISADYLGTVMGSLPGVKTIDVFYTNDNVKDRRSVSGAVTFSPISDTLGMGQLIPILKIGEQLHLFNASYDPFASFIFQQTVDTGAGVADGSVSYFKYGIGLKGYLLPEWIGNTIELSAKYTRWDPASASGTFNGYDSSGFVDLGITYILANSNRAKGTIRPWNKGNRLSQRSLENTALSNVEMGIQLGYVSGDNPDKGLKDEDMLTLTFTAKY